MLRYSALFWMMLQGAYNQRVTQPPLCFSTPFICHLWSCLTLSLPCLNSLDNYGWISMMKVFCAPLPMQLSLAAREACTLTHKHFSWIILQGSAGRGEQRVRYVSEMLYCDWCPAKLLWMVPAPCTTTKPNVESVAGLLGDELPLISSRLKAQM